MTPAETSVVVRREDPWSTDAQVLLDEMDATLAMYYGQQGRRRILHEELASARAAFVIVRTTTGIALGCGALRRMEYGVAELTCLYTRAQKAGIGNALLSTRTGGIGPRL